MLEIMPAKESSEKPITINSDSKFFKCTFEVPDEDMLLRVKAADCTSF